MKINEQMTLDDVDQEYKEFLEKFKPKKTTDDCYTPRNIYNVVLEWAIKEYGIDKTNVVRPFWPGGNYEKYNYPFGCTVVDNPPFSIITKICRDYNAAGIRFFLFAPYLTCFQAAAKENDVTFIVTGETITYENGAKVATAFITNLDGQYRARSAPDLSLQIKAADRENTTKGKKEIPKYAYPDNIVTAAMLGYMAKHGVDFRIRKESAEFIKKLDEMTRGAEQRGFRRSVHSEY